MPLDSDVSIGALVDQTEGYVGGDIEAVCREAGMRALRENLDAELVSWRHFESALAVIHASVTPEDIERFEKIEREMRRSTQAMETTPPGYI